MPAVSVPSTSAAPEVVLDAYLRSLVAGDCETARKLVVPTFVLGRGELCDATHVSAYRIDAKLALSSSEVTFGTTLTTAGTADRSILAGETIWFYSLAQQADGAWRIAGGGSGP